MSRRFVKILNSRLFSRRLLLLALLIFVFLPLTYFAVDRVRVFNYLPAITERFSASLPAAADRPAEPVYLPTPKPLRAVYMTNCLAAAPLSRDNLVRFIEETELNGVIIDIKDYSGTISFEPQSPELRAAWENSRCPAKDLKEFIAGLHRRGIYVIGRITVFQDPNLARRRPDLAVQRLSDRGLWSDFKGLHFTDPAAREVWDYHLLISREARALGFDELNFDYIRFPSDGPLKDIYFPISGNRPKSEVLEDFFEYLSAGLKESGVTLSADLFGLTTTADHDLNIGQIWERTLPYFDYLSPMVYPSHYPPHFNGWPNPNLAPYQTVKFSMDRAVERTSATTTLFSGKNSQPLATSTAGILYGKESYPPSRIRPWLQDFQYGGHYGPEEIRAQIQAVYDAGLDSWMFWDPANKYESLRKVLKVEL